MTVRIAFVGFRHGHILSLYSHAVEADDVEVVAACEEDRETRERLVAEGKVNVTHESIDAMLSEVDCDVVATGDYFARRGAIAIRALEAGKHVIADKPLCTSLDEQERIERLAREKGLKVGCQLDLRDLGPYVGVHDLVRAGEIGEVHAVSFNGQHALNLGVRPQWYFEPGKHGGTITDIAIHAFDFIEWATGVKFAAVNAARCWNALAKDCPHFKDGAQVMLTMENGCGVLGDVSYFAPSGARFRVSFNWRVTLWGEKGVIETHCTARKIEVSLAGADAMKYVEVPDSNHGGRLRAFLNDIAGTPEPGEMTTETVLRASRVAVTAQRAGDEGLHDIAL